MGLIRKDIKLSTSIFLCLICMLSTVFIFLLYMGYVPLNITFSLLNKCLHGNWKYFLLQSNIQWMQLICYLLLYIYILAGPCFGFARNNFLILNDFLYLISLIIIIQIHMTSLKQLHLAHIPSWQLVLL